MQQKETKRQSDVSKISASANYIINFYNSIQTITSYNAQYLTLMIEMRERSDGEKIAMNESEKIAMKDICNNIRYSANTCYISVMSMKDKVKFDEEAVKEIKERYKDLNKQYIFPQSICEELVISLNKLIVSSVMDSLLKKSSDIINELYGDSTDGSDRKTNI